MFFKPAIIVLLIITGILVITGCARHRFHSASPEKKAEWMVKKITKELDLDDSQQAKLNQIKTDMLDKRQEFHGMHGEFADELRTQLSSARIDQDKLNAMFTDKEAQFKEMRTLAIGKLAEFHAMLTPEQRSKLVEKMDDFKDKWKH